MGEKTKSLSIGLVLFFLQVNFREKKNVSMLLTSDFLAFDNIWRFSLFLSHVCWYFYKRTIDGIELIEPWDHLGSPSCRMLKR